MTSNGLRHPAKQAACLSLVLGVTFCASTSVGYAHQPLPADGKHSVIGCGKARALAERFIAEEVRQDDEAGAREALEDTDVLHYDLDLEISDLDPDNRTCTITGTNVMTIHNQSSGLTEFTFRLRGQYMITGAFVDGSIAVTVDKTSETTRVVTLDRAYAVNEEFTLTIGYAGTTAAFGLGSIDVSTQPDDTPIVATLSEPYYAHTWWPVKDGDEGLSGDNSDKATIDFSITVPDNFTVPSNGILQSVEPLPGSRVCYHWATDYPIAAYLVSFAATEYNTWTQDYVYPGGTMPVEFYIYPSNDSPNNRAAWGKVTEMLGVFSSLFGEYPFIDEKYGIYNFHFGGGMEHQTITGQGTFGEITTAHEAAHQWWGDMITCRTWSDIWLNEGFASYSECLWKEFETGTPNPSAYFARVQARKPGSVGDSVYIYPEDLTLARIFSAEYSYNKGCWVLHQLRHVVGNETFFEILADYRAAHEFSAATTDDFVAVASATYGADLTWFFDQWVYQIGAPAYQYAWATVNVEGQDYLLVEIKQVQSVTYPEVFTMPVDLVVTVGGSPETVTVWNDGRGQWFAESVGGPVTALEFDPDEWILRTSAMNVAYDGTPGDFDGDLDVDSADFTTFEQCFTGTGVAPDPGCEPGDFDDDQDIDCADWARFKQFWMGAGAPPILEVCDGAIPAVAEWGMVVMLLLLLTTGTIVFAPRPDMVRVVPSEMHTCV